ncbi:acetyltransferase [Pigmentiphaga kullae]|uniref:Sugar O-acyltransferase (Sialic acid O-acetyltransferase NeuD family) n=1 Tax=Pigmentiphaga kullae TaxID=151784 RepID=A0A4V2F411_9BURK|nr:acetyltransferase [Pigmentiphaga kullae]RZS85987.1 sugar O-acyltransferase (sialic acid O-acetyltransferase NeuD family) [Pigmentiphaga kullae]
MKRLAILGAGGHGRVVADAAEASEQWQEIVFFDDAWPESRNKGPWPILGGQTALLRQCQEFDGVVVGIGVNRVRLSSSETLVAAGARLATIIHPRATVSRHARVEAGSVIFAAAVVNIGAHIGRACIINTGATVDHDCQIADGVHLSPGANLAGGVTVGVCSWIGTNAGIRQQISIGAHAVIGMGAVVVSPQPDGITAVGNPAKALNRST